MTVLRGLLAACLTLSAYAAAYAQGGAFGDLRNLIDRGSKTHTDWAPPKSLKAWNVRRSELRAQILAAAGLNPMPERTPLRAQRFGRVDHDKYTVEKVVIETLPGLQVVGNLYLPARRGNSIPGVLVAHGHWKHGRVHHAEDYSVPALCVNLAAQGYAVFAWDMLGYNDTRALPHVFGDSEEEILWGFTPMGIQLWNSIRAIDFLQSLDFVNSSRIGMTGASGGGTQTFLTAAVDERIYASAPVDMVSAGFQGDDACEIAPSLRLGSNNVEITALIAPRPLMLVSSSKDWTRNTPQEEFPLLQAVYRLYNKTHRVRQAQIDAPHNYNQASRQAVYAFFAYTMQNGRVPEKNSIPEAVPMDLEPSTLLAGNWEGLTPHNKHDKKKVFDTWKTLMTSAAEDLSDEVWREALESASGIRWPEETHVLPVAANSVLTRNCCGDRVPIHTVPGVAGLETVIEIHGDGMNELRKIARKTVAPRLMLDPFQIGSAFAARPLNHGDHLTFHMSDDANRVQDILTAIAHVATEEKRVTVDLECHGGSMISLCQVAASLSHVPVTVITDGSAAKPVLIPGLLRLGGMDAVLRRRHQSLPAVISSNDD